MRADSVRIHSAEMTTGARGRLAPGAKRCAATRRFIAALLSHVCPILVQSQTILPFQGHGQTFVVDMAVSDALARETRREH